MAPTNCVSSRAFRTLAGQLNGVVSHLTDYKYSVPNRDDDDDVYPTLAYIQERNANGLLIAAISSIHHQYSPTNSVAKAVQIIAVHPSRPIMPARSPQIILINYQIYNCYYWSAIHHLHSIMLVFPIRGPSFELSNTILRSLVKHKMIKKVFIGAFKTLIQRDSLSERNKRVFYVVQNNTENMPGTLR